MFRRSIALLLMYFHLSHCSSRKQASFEVVLENIQDCKNINPPLAKKVITLPRYTINVVKGKRYVSWNMTIKAQTPFLNFSERTYSVDSAGRRVIRFQISQVSCKNILARSMLRFSNVSISIKNCMLHRGFYSYEDMDPDKIAHLLPGWHAPGTVIHEVQFVRAGGKVTEFCNEFTVKIWDPNKKHPPSVFPVAP